MQQGRHPTLPRALLVEINRRRREPIDKFEVGEWSVSLPGLPQIVLLRHRRLRQEPPALQGLQARPIPRALHGGAATSGGSHQGEGCSNCCVLSSLTCPLFFKKSSKKKNVTFVTNKLSPLSVTVTVHLDRDDRTQDRTLASFSLSQSELYKEFP